MTAVRIGNASGFYGDRFSAVEEMLTGGPLDVLTGDYLAELTMLILGRDRLKDPKLGYAKTFLKQLETGLGLALDRGVKIVSNAGGLNPAGLAEAIGELAARLGSVVLAQDGPDRVRLSGVQGEPPPASYKVSLNSVGGFRNEVTFVLTGLDVEAKAALVREQLAFEPAPAEVTWTLARLDAEDADTEERASALLRCVVKDPDPKKVGRGFSNAAVELALASYPGFHLTAPPGDASPYGVFTAGWVPAAEVPHAVVLPDGTRLAVEPAATTAGVAEVDEPALPEPLPAGPARRVPLGLVAGARSGDKGGDANVGVWVRSDDAWRGLAHALTSGELKRW